jgi:hypothetical protein
MSLEDNLTMTRVAGQSSAGRWREAAGSTHQVDDTFECGRNFALLTLAFWHQ